MIPLPIVGADALSSARVRPQGGDAPPPVGDGGDGDQFGDLLASLLPGPVQPPAPPPPSLEGIDWGVVLKPVEAFSISGEEEGATPEPPATEATAGLPIAGWMPAAAVQAVVIPLVPAADAAGAVERHGAADGTVTRDLARSMAAGEALREVLLAMHRRQPPRSTAGEPVPVTTEPGATGAEAPAAGPAAEGGESGDGAPAARAEGMVPRAAVSVVSVAGRSPGSEPARSGQDAAPAPADSLPREPAADPAPATAAEQDGAAPKLPGRHAAIEESSMVRTVLAPEAAGLDSSVAAVRAPASLSAPSGWSAPAAPAAASSAAGRAGSPIELPAPAPAPASQVTLQLDPDVTGATRIRVAVRGDVVHATIIADLAAAAPLALRLPELYRALRDRGFGDAQITVRAPAVDGVPAMVLSRPEPASSAANSGPARDGAEYRNSQRRSGEDDRPRQPPRDPEPEEHR